MSPSLSWIDPAELKELLTRMGVDASLPPEPNEEPPTLAAPTLAAPPPARSAPPPPPSFRPAPPPSRAPLAAPIDDANDAPRPPHFPPGMSVSERMSLFAAWLDLAIGRAPFYVAEPDGLVMHSRGVSDPHVLSSVALDRALRPVRGLLGTQQVAAITIELDSGQLSETIWAETPFGRAAVGVLPPRPLEPESVEHIREALSRVFDW